MHVWNVLHADRWNRLQDIKITQKSPSAHHRTTLSGYIFATKAIDNRKKLLNNISSTSSHNMVNFGPLTAEIGSWVWGTTANFNGSRIFVVVAPFCHVQHSHCVQILRSPLLAALLHNTGAVCVSGVWQGGELRNFRSSFAPPIFHRAAITLGIGPHSSSFFSCVEKDNKTSSFPRPSVTDRTFSHHKTCMERIINILLGRSLEVPRSTVICVWLYIACTCSVVSCNMVRWTWWDWSLSLGPSLPSLLLHGSFGP